MKKVVIEIWTGKTNPASKLCEFNTTVEAVGDIGIMQTIFDTVLTEDFYAKILDGTNGKDEDV